MSLQAIIYLMLLVISATISGFLAWYTWQHRQTVGAKPFSLLMLVLFQWGISYLLQITSTDLATKIFWSKVSFLGIVTTPVMWVLFALEYTGRKSWITRWRIIALFIVPLVTTGIVWTNESHHLFWTYRELRLVGDLVLMNSNNGFWFWVHAAYSYILLLVGAILIVRALLRWPTQYRGQMSWTLFALAAPWLANAITVFKLLPILIDLTPFAFTITGVGMAFALFRYHLLDMVPIARDVVIEGMKDGMIVLDASDRIVDINRAAEDILNLSGEGEPIGKQLVDVLTSWPELIERYQGVNEIQEEITLGEGESQRWYELNLSPLYDDRKNRVGQLIIARDITARKLAETLLQQSEARFRQIVENASDFIYRTDAEGYFTYVNPAALHAMGFTDEKEMIGKHYLDLTTPEVRHRMKRTYQRQFLSKTPNTYNEFPAITTDGRELWFGQNVQLLMEGDQVTGFQVLARDITAIKQAQDALRIAHDQALEASRAKSQLLAKVSHELRTPLGGILGYAELLHDGTLGSLEDGQMRAADEILQSSHYLTTMVNELLDEAQIQANTTILQERIFSPATLLGQATSGMEILAQKKGLGFTVFIDPSLPKELYGDDRRLRQILINLIGNAIKFTKEGEVRVSLLSPASEYWIMQVADTGMGIPKEAQAAIFDPFQQADNAITKENPGIGLGLSITKQLVELMGGRIVLESQVGEGSTFNVLLPVLDPPASQA
jgi:PAS domain S-box-containing protein